MREGFCRVAVSLPQKPLCPKTRAPGSKGAPWVQAHPSGEWLHPRSEDKPCKERHYPVINMGGGGPLDDGRGIDAGLIGDRPSEQSDEVLERDNSFTSTLALTSIYQGSVSYIRVWHSLSTGSVRSDIQRSANAATDRSTVEVAPKLRGPVIPSGRVPSSSIRGLGFSGGSTGMKVDNERSTRAVDRRQALSDPPASSSSVSASLSSDWSAVSFSSSSSSSTFSRTIRPSSM